MRTLAVLGCALFLLCGLSGCGTDVHDRIARDTLQALNDINKNLEKIKDTLTAEKYGGDLLAAYNRLTKNLAKDAQVFQGSLTQEEKEQLDEKYGSQFALVLQNINNQWIRLKEIQDKLDALELGKGTLALGIAMGSLAEKGPLKALPKDFPYTPK